MKDLTGQTFGLLEVRSYEPKFKQVKKSNGQVCWNGGWKCHCACGKSRTVPVVQLTGGRAKSCGCISKNKSLDLLNQKFSSLLVLKREKNTSTGKTQWLCLCDCGTKTIIVGDKLVSGRQVSCGCSKLQYKPSLLRIENQKKAYLQNRIDLFESISKDLTKAHLVLKTTLVDFLATAESPHRLQLSIQCEKGHDFNLAWFNFSQNGTYCRKCEQFRSSEEKDLRDWLFTEFDQSKVVTNAKWIVPEVNEVDFWIPEKKLAIEYNGLYWHSKGKKTRHLIKREILERHGITLVQINSDEWEFRTEVVKSILRARLGLIQIKYMARQLSYRKVPKKLAEEFLEWNHLMGASTGASYHGLWDKEGHLISLMSTKRRGKDLEIARFCNANNVVVSGGLSRLLSKVDKTDYARVVSFVDLRYGTGISLKSLGFKMKQVTLGWKWTNYQRTFNRLKCRAQMDDRKLSESEHALELGWVKTYDAGQALWVLDL
jgi:hypothetical protein